MNMFRVFIEHSINIVSESQESGSPLEYEEFPQRFVFVRIDTFGFLKQCKHVFVILAGIPN